ncbi:MAG: redoxin domain-containing protein [Gemmatimonadetes bacterium]|nr:TlpA family protein disulfide reductase [Gemmatimonadota bacterium]NIR78695.1 TlpA family protein disulfide reductase [Gemmatimonadota bacterium]NIT87334.1 TlpA family protein disulfide reductase [Gemmatimonadota bacterium]NIU31178.1 TlpA family protein disulfide reductase [Gemmatimonadota bacterium]NIU35900.1 redoxin domain-containing protein [Gemmatimonadota bacterium]
MKTDSSRLPYLLATAALAVVLTLAWVNRARFAPVVPGSEAPTFEVQDLRGEPVTLEDFEGEVVLLNIWATWCLPCRTEMPSMQRLYREFEGRPFEVVAVSVDARRGGTDAAGRPGGDVAEFAESMDLTFTILHDPSGRIQQTYGTTGVPESFLIGSDGVIYKRVTGATEWDAPEHRQLVERLLEEAPRASASP